MEEKEINEKILEELKEIKKLLSKLLNETNDNIIIATRELQTTMKETTEEATNKVRRTIRIMS